MKLDIGNELETLGLSQNEAKVYLASLRTGPTTAQMLAAKSGISRPTTYIMIESLMKKGLMSSYIKGKKKFFAAANPNQLTYIVNGLKQEALAKEAAVGKIVEALGKMVEEEKAATTIRVLEGPEGTHELQRDVLESGATETFELVNVDEARKWIPPMHKGDIREKITTKTKCRSLYTYSKGKIIDRIRPEGSKTESRYLDGSKYPIVGEVAMYADRVALTSYSPKKVTVIIRDPGVAQTMKTLFTSLWEKGEQE
ncbi:MAG: hypothetical protein RLZZ324_13 [Candidatus Parcubacteria bacterium]|jgi:sugar-specific transcriptional regulator TrmB